MERRNGQSLAEVRALMLLEENPGLSWQELARLVPCSGRSARRYRAKVKDINLSNFDAWMGLCRQASKLENAANFHRKNADWKAEETLGDWVGLVLMSDLHEGSLYADHDRIALDFELLRTIPGLYALLNGDLIQNTQKDFPDAESVFSQAIAPHRQLQIILAAIEYAGVDNFVGFGLGNHDARTERLTGFDHVGHAIHSLGIDVFRGPAILRMRIGSQEYVTVFAHKFSGKQVRNPAGPAGKLRAAVCPTADLSVVSHWHCPAILTFPAFPEAMNAGINMGGICINVVTGTYQYRGEPYGSNFAGGGLYGPVTVLFNAKTKMLLPFWSPEAALQFALGRKRAQQFLNTAVRNLAKRQ